jgi:hypothetical protein
MLAKKAHSHLFILGLAASLLIAGCSTGERLENAETVIELEPAGSALIEEIAPQEVSESLGDPGLSSADWGEVLMKSDSQGAIDVSVTPVDLNNPGDMIVFEVSLNTHSVELSMDLAELASLSTDTGRTVRAALWDGPRGGHHVGGNLSFPAIIDGVSILNGAGEVRLVINDLDAPERVFVWQKR